MSESSPSLIAEALPGSKVRLTVSLAGYDKVAIDSKRETAVFWYPIAVCNQIECIDARPPFEEGRSEVRKYRCQGMEDGERVGPISETVIVFTVP